ncbi:hypothetical protein J41TS4_29170 [Paenibacillus apis]|uniref:Uncharacterized protein n=1 Tax=Paenibacillus apis TaxID=1792174 RepID=A0A919Y278_9BACL|nr:hypothetical protein J41TS4_29170 [Paenibacillus apis]
MNKSTKTQPKIKTPMHISQFSQEIQDFIHHLCARAILRAIKNGTFQYKN